MNESLQQRCEYLIKNDELLRQSSRLEYEYLIKLGALLYTFAERDVDPAKIKECQEILKQKVGMFSGFRGSLGLVVRVKMSLADDPEAYADAMIDAYNTLKGNRKLVEESLTMAAMTICDLCPPDQLEEVTENVHDLFDAFREIHPWITNDAQATFIALMVLAGKDVNETAREAEQIFQLLKENACISSSTAQTVAMVLALSDKPIKEKIERFFALYEACKNAKHEVDKGKSMAIYAAFADVDMPIDELVAQIGEVDDWLKGKKGFGALGVGASQRRLIASSLVLEDYQKNGQAVVSTGASSAVTQAIVTDLVLIIVSIIVTSIVVNSIIINS